VTVMPCYDKKLEASRKDFYNDVYSTRDVDCVITTGELELLMRERGWDLSSPVPDEDEQDNAEELPELLFHPGTSSGSYLQSLILQVTSSESCELGYSSRTVRNDDYEECTITRAGSGDTVFKGAKCYGFRNLQNLVRKIGKDAGVQVGRGAAGKLSGIRGKRIAVRGAGVDRGYDYVEVMACPGGCVNGGGQLRPRKTADAEGYNRDWPEMGVKIVDDPSVESHADGGKWNDREWLKRVETSYWDGVVSAEQQTMDGAIKRKHVEADRLAAVVLRELCQPTNWPATGGHWSLSMDEAAESRRQGFFRTQYRKVESDVIGLMVNW